MASMTTEETFKFFELYQAENCLWNPKNKYHKNKNVINDSWKRIADAMGVPIHELKKKKDNLLATFRANLKKYVSSKKSGAGAEEVYHPIWPFYDVMAAFLTDVYLSTSLMNSEENTQLEEASTSKVQSSDILPETKNDDDDDADVHSTPKRCTSVQSQKRRAMNPPELQEASRKMSTAFNALNSALSNKEKAKEEDECDFFCKMLAKQIKEYPKLEREEIMYELHGVMLNRRRRFDRLKQARSYTVSSPAQVIINRPSTSNSVYLSQTTSPNYVIDSPYSVESLTKSPPDLVDQQSETVNVLSQEIIVPRTSRASRACYESFGDVLNTDNY